VNDLKAMLRRLRREGYEVTKGKRSSHWHVRDGSGRLVAVIGSTPSDRKALRNLLGRIRRTEAGR
jgi:hypothetical protein